MRVIVTGCVATYPVGGVARNYLQYVQGFQQPSPSENASGRRIA